MATRIMDEAAKVFADPMSYTDEASLHAALTHLRANAPVSWVEVPDYRPFWAITKHADIMAIERANDLFLSEPRPLLATAAADDYMAAGRPILALAPRDAALYELLEDSGAGHCVEAGDVDGIEKVLEQSLFGGAPPARTRVERFQWSNLAQDYLHAINAAGGDTPAANVQEPARRVVGSS